MISLKNLFDNTFNINYNFIIINKKRYNMENRRNNPFNRSDYLKSNIAGLLQSESKGLNLVTGRLNIVNKAKNF